MKRYYEYTKENLVVLNEEEIQLLIDLEIAYAGIIPQIEPNYEVVPECLIEKKDMVYRVHGLNVGNEEDAKTLSNIRVFKESYEYDGAGYNYKYLDKEGDFGTIGTERYYTEFDVKKLSGELKKKQLIEKSNEEKRLSWRKYQNTIEGIENTVFDCIREARSWQSKKDQAIRTFKKHLLLADNDYDVAVKFFKDAYKDEADLIESVLSSWIQENTVATEKG